MNKFFGILLAIAFLIALCFMDLTGQRDDSAQVEKYFITKGKTQIPRSLRKEIGKGI